MANRRWFETRLIKANGTPDLISVWSTAMEDKEIHQAAQELLVAHPGVARVVITEKLRKPFYSVDAGVDMRARAKGVAKSVPVHDEIA